MKRRTLSLECLGVAGCLALGCGGVTEPQETTATSRAEAAPVQQDQVASTQDRDVRVQSSHATFARDLHDRRDAKNDKKRASAAAELERTNRSRRSAGTLRFEQRGSKVVLVGNFKRLPKGMHGLQIHENGDCRGRFARRSGADFNPTDSRHGPPESGKRHVGDLGNIEVGKNGKASFDMTTNSMTITEGGPSSVLQRSVVITAREDDGRSQPNGNAGPAIACGVIKAR